MVAQKKRPGRFGPETHRLILIFCLWIAFGLRVWGLDFGLPYEFHPDEHKYVDEALNWHLTGDMLIRYVNPPLFTYVLIGADWLWLFVSPFAHSVDWITATYVYARLWNVAFGVLAVALVYRLGKCLYNTTAGSLATVLLAGLFLPARESHFAVNDTLLTFFSVLAVYFSVKLFQRHNLTSYLLAGVAVGLASGSKLTGGLVVIVPVVAHMLAVIDRARTRRDWFSWQSNQHLFLSLLVALGTFLAISPGIILHPVEVINEIFEHLQFGAEGYNGLRMTPTNGWGFYLYVLGWGGGWLMLVAIFLSLGANFWLGDRAGIILGVFPLTLFAYMGGQKLLFARFLLPALPILIVLVTVSLTRSTERWSNWRSWQTLLWPIVVVLLLGQSLANLIWFDHLLTLTDTRAIATDWFTEQFPEGTVVAKENYSILPQIAYLHDTWPYQWVYLDEKGPSRDQVDFYVANKAQIIVLSSYIFERIRLGPASEKQRSEQLTLLQEKAELIKTFSPYREDYQQEFFYHDQVYGPAGETLQRVRPGPIIKIYRLPYENQPYSLAMPAVPVVLNANFANQMILLGYNLPVRRAEPGGTFPLTLYWQAVSRMDQTYVISNHLLDDQQRNWGGYDRWPQETANTILWHPGEVVIDSFSLPIAADTPAGIYNIDIGLYRQSDPAAIPLPLVEDGKLVDQNSVRIGPVKVGSPPQGITVAQAVPQTELHLSLGSQIKLLGFDLESQLDREPQGLDLTFYWQALTTMEIDYTVFIHLRNGVGEIVAQKDGPPVGGVYPTSLWDAGEIIRDEVSVPLGQLEPGVYEAVVGMYDFETGQRLPVDGSPEGMILLRTLEINE